MPGLLFRGGANWLAGQVKGRLRGEPGRQEGDKLGVKAPPRAAESHLPVAAPATGRAHRATQLRDRSRNTPQVAPGQTAGGSAEGCGEARPTADVTKWHFGPCRFRVCLLPKDQGAGAHIMIQALGIYPPLRRRGRWQREAHALWPEQPCSRLGWRFRQWRRLIGVPQNLITRLVSETSR